MYVPIISLEIRKSPVAAVNRATVATMLTLHSPVTAMSTPGNVCSVSLIHRVITAKFAKMNSSDWTPRTFVDVSLFICMYTSIKSESIIIL